MRIESECNQQKTGSCYGCPVLEELLDEVRSVAICRPSKIYSEMGGLVDNVAERSCPTGLKPQVSQLSIRNYGRDLGGRTVTVDLKR